MICGGGSYNFKYGQKLKKFYINNCLTNKPDKKFQ